MPDGSSTLNQVKISELPVAPTVNDADQLEANQAGTSRSITVGQVKAAAVAAVPVPPLGVFNVRSFGAVGNGVTDDTAAIQAAINYAAAQGGGTVYLPAATYPTSAPLNITTSGITLLGDNLNSSRILSTATTGNIVAVAGTAMASQVLGTTIRNLRIDAPVTRTAGHGISLRFVARTTVENVVLNTMWNGMEIYAANDTLVHRVNAPSLRGDYGFKYYAAGDGSNRSDVCSIVDSSIDLGGIAPVGNGDGTVWDGGAFTFRIYRSEMLQCRYGMWILNTANSATWFPSFGVFSDLEVDQAFNTCLKLDAGQRLEFANCFCAGNSVISGPIVFVGSDTSRAGTISFMGGNFQGANSNVFDIAGRNTRIVGVTIGDQRVAASAIVMRAAAVDFTIADNIFTIVGGGHNGTYGVELQAGASKGVVGPNDYTTMTTGDVLNSSGTSSITILGGVSRTAGISPSALGTTSVTGTASFSGTATMSGTPGWLVGYGTAVGYQTFGGASQTPLAQIAVTGQSSLSIQRYVNGSANCGTLNFSKSQNATLGGHTVVLSNDLLGLISFNGSDGTNFVEGAYIRAEVDGTPGTTDMPARICFATSPDGTAVPVERLRISNTGDLTGNITKAVGAGAVGQAFIKASSTANLGIYYGTGVPGFSAAKGSLYSCTNATTTTTRLYVNTDGASTWATITTSA